ncbi:MAG: FprA family A-type flavoprotein, partial [Muribaculaceae bacterium]|nr:FprA family A-type flavoprotein [Muribaculaceae bacterium]
GADDLDLRLFENQYPTPKGMSYNSYLIRAGKIAVADTIDVRCTDRWLAHLDEELGAEQPDYLIVHHMEPDHSANIEVFMERYPKAVLVATAKAIAMLPQFFGGNKWPDRVLAVKENDTLDLDGLTLRFILAPMIHWPEVMMTYIPELKTLLSADAFGKFGANEFEDDWVSEARRYYINIVGKYGTQVQTLLRKVSSLDIDTIMPLHGPVLDGNLSNYIGLYDTWSSYRPETEGVLVAYASVYGGTAECAARLADILRGRGVETVLFDLCRGDMSEAVGQAFRMSRMVLATVTYDGGVFTPMVDFINHLAAKTYRGRKVGFIENGSWAPVAARMMMKQMEPMRDIEFVAPFVTIRSRMDENTITQLEALADAILA